MYGENTEDSVRCHRLEHENKWMSARVASLEPVIAVRDVVAEDVYVQSALHGKLRVAEGKWRRSWRDYVREHLKTHAHARAQVRVRQEVHKEASREETEELRAVRGADRQAARWSSSSSKCRSTTRAAPASGATWSARTA